MKFHTLGGGGRDKFGSFSLFFLLVLSHANMKRKVFFVGVVKFHTYFFLFRLRTSLQCVCPKQGSVNEGSELQNMDLELGLIKCY